MAASPNISGQNPLVSVSQPLNAVSSVPIGPGLFLPKTRAEQLAEAQAANEANYKTGQILAFPPVGDSVSPYQEALEDMQPRDKENLKLNKAATAPWFRAMDFLKNSGKKVQDQVLDVASEIVPATGHVIDQAGTNRKNAKLVTHAALGGAGLVGLSAIGDFVDTLKSLFGWHDSPVPSLVNLVNGLAKAGFAILIGKKASSGEPLQKQELMYSGAGLIMLKLIVDAMKGVGPLSHIPGIKDLIGFTQETLKSAGAGTLQGAGEAAPARAE